MEPYCNYLDTEEITTTPTIKAYKNGVLIVCSFTSSVPIVLISPIDLLRVNQSDSYRTNGQMDDFAIFPTALSAQEIYSIYKSNVPIQTEDQSSILAASEIFPITSGGVSKLILAGSVAGNVGVATNYPQKLHVEGQCVTGDTL